MILTSILISIYAASAALSMGLFYLTSSNGSVKVFGTQIQSRFLRGLALFVVALLPILNTVIVVSAVKQIAFKRH